MQSSNSDFHNNITLMQLSRVICISHGPSHLYLCYFVESLQATEEMGNFTFI